MPQIFKVKFLVYTTITFKGNLLSHPLVSFTIFSPTVSWIFCSHTYKMMKNVSRFLRWALMVFKSCKESCLQPQLFYRSVFKCIQTVLIPGNFFLHIFWAQVFLLHPQGQTSGVGSDDLTYITAASCFLILKSEFLPVDVHPDCCKDHYSSSLL